MSMIPHAALGHSAQQQAVPCPTPLKYQRLLRGWSQQDVVNALVILCRAEGLEVGLTTNTVARWENGSRLPRPLYRKHLCTLYGLTAVQLGFLKALEVQL